MEPLSVLRNRVAGRAVATFTQLKVRRFPFAALGAFSSCVLAKR